jgi:predicted N-acyltransferase
MGYQAKIAPSVDDLPEDDWNSVTAGQGNVCMDRSFIRAAERSAPEAGKLWSVLVYDGARPVAAACLSLVAIDAVLLAPKWAQRLVRVIRRVFPRYLRFKVLFSALPVAGSANNLVISSQADRAQVLRLLDEQMRVLARQQRASILVVMDFDESELGELAELQMLGYTARPWGAVSYLNCGFGSTFAEFQAALERRYRANLARSERKFAAAEMRLERLRGGAAVAARYTDEIHRLCEAVATQSDMPLEVAPAEFFRELARQFPDDFRLILALRRERVVGFVLGIHSRPNAVVLSVGIDYEQNRQGDVYFNLLYHIVGELLGPGVTRLHYGVDAGEFKGRLGCHQRRHYLFVRATNWLQGPLRWFSRLLFPAIALRETQHVFRNPQQGVESATPLTATRG